MNKRLQIEHLGRLLHMEVHMVSAYDDALARTHDDDAQRERLSLMRADHESHTLALTELLREMGEPAPGPTPEVEAMFAPAVSALGHASSAEDVSHATRMAEQVVARAYDEARDWGVGLQVHDLIAAHADDEQRHVAALNERVGARSPSR